MYRDTSIDVLVSQLLVVYHKWQPAAFHQKRRSPMLAVLNPWPVSTMLVRHHPGYVIQLHWASWKDERQC